MTKTQSLTPSQPPRAANKKLQHDDAEDVRLLKFDLQQAKETLQLKLDQVKQLQTQVTDLKRKKNAESKKQIDNLQATVDLQSVKIQQLQSDLDQKSDCETELKRQLDELVQTREINLSLGV